MSVSLSESESSDLGPTEPVWLQNQINKLDCWPVFLVSPREPRNLVSIEQAKEWTHYSSRMGFGVEGNYSSSPYSLA